MMKFSDMERAEILAQFKQAKEPLKQVRIMADLYACKPTDIKTALIEAGVNPDDVDLRKQPKKNAGSTPPLSNSSKLPSALACLRDELRHLDDRASAIPDMIAQLQHELDGIDAKKRAIIGSIELLKEVIE